MNLIVYSVEVFHGKLSCICRPVDRKGKEIREGGGGELVRSNPYQE